MGRRGRQTYKIPKYVVGPFRLDCIPTAGSILDPVMRCGSILLIMVGGELHYHVVLVGGEPVLYATAFSSNFETDIVTRPGLLNVQCRKYFLGTWHSQPY